jgi:hypothetical protein
MIQFVAAGATPIALVSSFVGRYRRWRSGRTTQTNPRAPAGGFPDSTLSGDCAQLLNRTIVITVSLLLLEPVESVRGQWRKRIAWADIRHVHWLLELTARGTGNRTGQGPPC